MVEVLKPSLWEWSRNIKSKYLLFTPSPEEVALLTQLKRKALGCKVVTKEIFFSSFSFSVILPPYLFSLPASTLAIITHIQWQRKTLQADKLPKDGTNGEKKRVKLKYTGSFRISLLLFLRALLLSLHLNIYLSDTISFCVHRWSSLLYLKTGAKITMLFCFPWIYQSNILNRAFLGSLYFPLIFFLIIHHEGSSIEIKFAFLPPAATFLSHVTHTLGGRVAEGETTK